MKKTTIIIIALIFASFTGFSQTKIVRDANGNFVTQKAPKKASEDKATGQTFLTAKGEEFPVYVSERGKYYVLRTSKETGNQYKQYLKID
jgi:uncharacterized protein YxeA